MARAARAARPVPYHPVTVGSRDPILLLDHPVDQHDHTARQEAVEDPYLVAAKLEQVALAGHGLRVGRPHLVTASAELQDQRGGFTGVPAVERAQERPDRELAAYPLEVFDRPPGLAHRVPQAHHDYSLEGI
jgi:hypothetical protein